MSPITIQKVSTEKQISSVKDLASEIWNEHFTNIIGSDQVDYMLSKFQSETAISEQLENGFEYYLMSDQHQHIGYMAIKQKAETLFLSKLYLYYSERGKGYGKQAVHYLQQLAQQKGFKKISLTVNKDNINTINAYKKMGFKIINSMVLDIGGGFFMDDYEMEIKV